MGIFDRLFRREGKMTSLDLFRQIYGGRESSSGVVVNIDKALETATIFGICRVLADGVAQVPLKMFQKVNGNRVDQSSHPVAMLLSERPNKFQTAFEFFETMMFHLPLAGDFFAFKNVVGRDKKLVELIPLLPGGMTVKRRPDMTMSYEYQAENGERKVFPAESIWHVRGPSWNGWKGMEGVKMARNAIGLGMALEEAHASLHKSGARTSGLLSVEGALSPDKYAELAAWLDRYEIGGDRYQKAMLLDKGAKFTPYSMTGVDSQHLETRKHQIEELCRQFRVLPVMVGHADKTATYASAEQMFLAHVVHTMTPWYVRIEQSAKVNLLTEEERRSGFYLKFNANALMRGAAEARAKYYSAALGAGGTKGWMTQNDVRDLEEMDRVNDPEADKLPQPTNAGAAAQSPAA